MRWNKIENKKREIDNFLFRNEVSKRSLILKELENFFREMKSNEKVTNSKLVEYLENVKKIEITNEIKTDIVLELVKVISKKGIIKREKEEENNKFSKWIYVKV